MIKVLARRTNNAENFMDKEKEENLSANAAQNFALVCMGFWLPRVQPLIFCHLIQCHRIFDKIFRYSIQHVIYVKLQAFVEMRMTRNQTKHSKTEGSLT